MVSDQRALLKKGPKDISDTRMRRLDDLNIFKKDSKKYLKVMIRFIHLIIFNHT